MLCAFVHPRRALLLPCVPCAVLLRVPPCRARWLRAPAPRLCAPQARALSPPACLAPELRARQQSAALCSHCVPSRNSHTHTHTHAHTPQHTLTLPRCQKLLEKLETMQPAARRAIKTAIVAGARARSPAGGGCSLAGSPRRRPRPRLLGCSTPSPRAPTPLFTPPLSSPPPPHHTLALVRSRAGCGCSLVPIHLHPAQARVQRAAPFHLVDPHHRWALTCLLRCLPACLCVRAWQACLGGRAWVAERRVDERARALWACTRLAARTHHPPPTRTHHTHTHHTHALAVFIVLRNMTPSLRLNAMGLFGWLGCITLETCEWVGRPGHPALALAAPRPPACLSASQPARACCPPSRPLLLHPPTHMQTLASSTHGCCPSALMASPSTCSL